MINAIVIRNTLNSSSPSPTFFTGCLLVIPRITILVEIMSFCWFHRRFPTTTILLTHWNFGGLPDRAYERGFTRYIGPDSQEGVCESLKAPTAFTQISLVASCKINPNNTQSWLKSDFPLAHLYNAFIVT
jgi:hypothetical protein